MGLVLQKIVTQLVEVLTKIRKVAVSIPDGFIRHSYRHIISGCIVTLGSTQPLTKISTRNIFWEVQGTGA